MRAVYSYAASLMALSAVDLAASAETPVISVDNRPLGVSKGAKKRNKTGRSYPFASERQNARYARQIAAGQLRFV